MFRPTFALKWISFETNFALLSSAAANKFAILSMVGYFSRICITMSFEERSVKVQGQFPERTTHARFVHETDHDGPQNDEFTLGVAIKGN